MGPPAASVIVDELTPRNLEGSGESIVGQVTDGSESDAPKPASDEVDSEHDLGSKVAELNRANSVVLSPRAVSWTDC